MARTIICLDGETWVSIEAKPSILTITDDAYNDMENGLLLPKNLTAAHVLSEIVLSEPKD